MAKLGKSELISIVRDLGRKPLTDSQARTLIESLWRDMTTAVTHLQVIGITLTSASWALVSGLYEYNLANASITVNSMVDIIPDNASIDIVKAAGILPKTLSSAGSVKMYATNAPTANIGITIIITQATL